MGEPAASSVRSKALATALALWGPRLVALLGWFGVAVFATRWCQTRVLSMPVVFIAVALSSAALLTAWLARSGLSRAWPVLAILSLLPLTLLAGGLVELLAGLAMWLAAAHVLERARKETAGAQKLGPWQLSVLAVAGLIGVFYVAIAWHAEGNLDNDAAYYYGVARHIVATGRYEEPILWHFLGDADDIVRPPFDYWGGVTSLFLVPVMALFGTGYKVAVVAISLVSAGCVVAFAYLVAVARPLRCRALQLAALLVFAFSPAMAGYRFDTESVPIAQLLLVLSLIALARRRHLAAAVLAFSLFLTRGDNAICCLLIWAFCAAALAGDRVQRKRQLLSLGAVIAALVAMYLAFSFLSFGSALPPGSSRAVLLGDYWDLYSYSPGVAEPMQGLGVRFTGEYLAERLSMVVTTLRQREFVSSIEFWLVGVLFAGLAFMRQRDRAGVIALVFALATIGVFATAWAAGAVFAPHRTLHSLLPVVVLAGAYGFDLLFSRLGAVLLRKRWMLVAALANAALLAICYAHIVHIEVYGHRVADDWLTGPQVTARLGTLDSLLNGQAVATTQPWRLVANTRSPAMSVPGNGEEAMEAALRRYRPAWLLIWGSGMRGPSQSVLERVGRGEVAAIGAIGLEPVRVALPHMRLFRLDYASQR